MKRSSLFLSVIVCFSFVLVGCTDCNDDTSASVDESPVSFAEPSASVDEPSASVNEPSASIDDPPAPIDEPPVSPPSLGLCRGANSASERSLWNADLSNQHNENLHPVDEIPTPLDVGGSTLSSICDRDDLDSDYIVWDGDVTINNLESLGTYTLIKGDIVIRYQQSIELIDLPELQIVCGEIEILGNDNLQNFNLPQLTMVNQISLVYNETLKAIHLPQLQSTTRELRIYRNDLLESLTLLKLHTVGDDLTLTEASMILETIDLPQLQTIGGSVFIQKNVGLTSINLPQLQSVDRWELSITSNDKLTCIDLSRLQTSRIFQIEYNELLQNLYLSKLHTVGSDFTLSQSSVLLERIDLPQLQTIGGDGRITKHDGATSINLPQLQSVGDGFFIAGNDRLTSIDLSNLQTVGVNEDTLKGLYLTNLPSGPMTITLPKLQSIEGALNLFSLHNTTDILMPQLQAIGKWIEIKDSSSITNIALPQLQSLGGSFYFDETFNPTQCDLGSYTNDKCP